MTPRRKYYLDVWDSIDEVWVKNFETYQYGEMLKKWRQLEEDGYDVQYRYEVPNISEENKND